MNELFNAMQDKEDAKVGKFYTEIYLNLLDAKYDLGIQRLEAMKENGGGFLFSKLFAKGLLPTAYVRKGDYAKAEESIKDAVKNILAKNKHFSMVFGAIALAKNDYKSAIEEFTISLGLHLSANPAKFNSYTKRAEAYEGLKEFDKARKDYEAALIYQPDYEPALNGLARLEGRVITERKTDKIPPQVIITEPEVSRGLIVKAGGNDIMIKGMAADPAGLRSVTINGQKVYSQAGGTFWGTVALKEGFNKVVVAATDMAGNTGEQVFDIERTANANGAPVSTIKEGKNYALLIGCQNYDDSNIPSLEAPIGDAIKLKLILKNSYNFSDENLFTLFNPERSDFKKKFLEIYEVIQPEDNLVIFYAGHGIWVEKEKSGYWMLTDAKLNDVNTWLSNKEVLEMITRVPARHTLLITDACFSGSVFKTRGLSADMPLAMQQMNEKISRVAITSGNDTEVPDKSVFMKYLVKALSENKDKYLTAQKMFINQIIEAVMTETKTEPRYGTLELAGHIGGDYIFTRK
ncbi:MAG: caspase family protein [Chitinophagaceae bacterium]